MACVCRRSNWWIVTIPPKFGIGDWMHAGAFLSGPSTLLCTFMILEVVRHRIFALLSLVHLFLFRNIVMWTCCHMSTGALNWNEKLMKSPHLALCITLVMYKYRSWYLPAMTWLFKTNGCQFAFLCCVMGGSEVIQEWSQSLSGSSSFHERDR